ncbi:MAG: hypothetical protein ACRC01_05785 [Deefgea sp.]
MLRKSLVSLVTAGLFMPSFAHAEFIDDLLNINDILGSLCGQRMMVLWVDETEQVAPCVLAYSERCVEAQAAGTQSCNQNIETVAAEPEQLQAIGSVSAK